ncbi:MAG TPA: amino acid deaminase [Pilimelia sp.]|nr:amino acid deaminase [Pilimelia sp.]
MHPIAPDPAGNAVHPIAPDPARLDLDAMRALDDAPLDWRTHAVPPAGWGLSARAYAARRPPLRELGTPLVTLDAGALHANLTGMAHWCAARGLDLAPHGKTTMAPRLWADQVTAGAWAITVANAPQLRVALAFGVSRVLVAGTLLDPAVTRWLAAELARRPGHRVVSFVDSTAAVAQLDAALRAGGPDLAEPGPDPAGPGRDPAAPPGDAGRQPAGGPLEVCVELGVPGGRTGCRSVTEALAVAAAVRATGTLRLVGVAGYEGAVAGDARPQSLSAVDAYLGRLAALHRGLAERGWYAGTPALVTAGGSAYLDRIAAVLGPLGGADTRVLLRAGAYLVHDDGFYRGISAAARAADGPALRSAMHGWARVVSRPEPGLALLDAGRRDLPFDQGLPAPQRVLGRDRQASTAALAGARVTALNDQHAFLALAPDSDLAVGEVVRLGLSHPCTALDKWRLLPVVADADAAEPIVVDLVHTFF